MSEYEEYRGAIRCHKCDLFICKCCFPSPARSDAGASSLSLDNEWEAQREVELNSKLFAQAALIKELTEALVFYHDNISSHVALEDGHVPCRTCDLLARAKGEGK